MELDELGVVEQPVVNTSIIHEAIDYSAFSLLQLASMAEAEITGQSILQFQDSMRLQLIIVKSQVRNKTQQNLDKLQTLLNDVKVRTYQRVLKTQIAPNKLEN